MKSKYLLNSSGPLGLIELQPSLISKYVCHRLEDRDIIIVFVLNRNYHVKSYC